MGSNRITVFIYEEDATMINKCVFQYPHIETGGDLFGLWQTESEVVVQLAIGPGENCRRTTTAFFQDERYLGSVGNHLTSTEGMCNIGEWHSHHSLNLPEPSGGDKQTIWRHLPTYKLDRFLLFIATINRTNGLIDINSFMFTSPENASRQGGMFSTAFVILPGPNPYRAQNEIVEKLSQGAERSMVRGFVGGEKESKKEKKRRKKEEERRKKEEKSMKKQEKRDKEKMEKREKKEMKKQEKRDKEDMKREEKKENKGEKNKKKGKEMKRNENWSSSSLHDQSILGKTQDYWNNKRQEDRKDAQRKEGSPSMYRQTYI